jgi:hypothetical protein
MSSDTWITEDWAEFRERFRERYERYREFERLFLVGRCSGPVRVDGHLLPCELTFPHEGDCVAHARWMNEHDCKRNGCRELCDHGRRRPCETCDPYIYAMEQERAR